MTFPTLNNILCSSAGFLRSDSLSLEKKKIEDDKRRLKEEEDRIRKELEETKQRELEEAKQKEEARIEQLRRQVESVGV